MIQEIAQKAKAASIKMASLSTDIKNQALNNIGQALKANASAIIEANEKDLAQAEKDNLNQALLKRLKFGQAKLDDVVDGIDQLVKLNDPVGQTLSCTELDNNLELYKVTCPIGVLGIIFESRPDALVQISTLGLKSSNAVLLKGGSEAANTNRILTDIINEASVKSGIPENWINLLETREDVKDMLSLDEYIDLIIPRGSNEFVKYIMDNTRVAVLGHADGICHVYIDNEANMDKALRIAHDSKCQYAAVCNAMETLLVNSDIAADFLPKIKEQYDKSNVELRGDQQTQKIIDVAATTDQDWKTEYNDLILSIKIVNNIEEAIEHINTFGSHHTDAIVTENKDKAKQFIGLIDSGDVFWNASTRFSDGFRYGLGAEVGISTNKIHARGPVGLEGLIIYKWLLLGEGQTVSDFSGNNGKKLQSNMLDKKCPI